MQVPSRRMLVTSLLGFSVLPVVLSGCMVPRVANIANIVDAIQIVKILLTESRKISNDTVYSVNVSYKELGKFLNDKNFSTAIVQKMEQRKFQLSQAASSLRSKLNQTNTAATELFALLETRASQNSTSELKDKMIAGINDKKRQFEEKLKIAGEVLTNVDKSVQKYDDILGYIQVGSGLNQVDQYINDVDTVIAEAQVLDREIQGALSESQRIVASFEKG